MKNEINLAFIDGQNLYYGTKENNWKIDFKKFRIYVKDKYNVAHAYYFLGYVDEEQRSLYTNLQEAGFILVFREHHSGLMGTKKGNLDTDIVFEIMKSILEKKDFHKILLVSGDGDYKRMVDYLISKKRFKKILFPYKKQASSLYRQLPAQFFDYLESKSVRRKIEYI